MTNCRERIIKVRVRVKGDSFIDQVQLYEGREVKRRDNTVPLCKLNILVPLKCSSCTLSVSQKIGKRTRHVQNGRDSNYKFALSLTNGAGGGGGSPKNFFVYNSLWVLSISTQNHVVLSLFYFLSFARCSSNEPSSSLFT